MSITVVVSQFHAAMGALFTSSASYGAHEEAKGKSIRSGWSFDKQTALYWRARSVIVHDRVLNQLLNGLERAP